MKKVPIILAIISIMVGVSFSQTNDTTGRSEINWYAYPVFFYTPETNFAFGGLAILLFRLANQASSKPSTIRLVGYYTLNNQYSIAIKPEIYFNKDKFLIESDLAFSKIVDKFYGIGNSTEEIDNPEYDSKIISFQFQILYEIIKNMRAGISYEFRKTKNTDLRKNPFLLEGSLPGSPGGTNSGIGAAIRYDSRNNIFYPSSGGFYDFALLSFNDNIGSDFNYIKWYLDLRRYFSLSQNQILAYQLYINRVNGTAPFYDVPPLGGEDLMRGYYTGRFRDDNYFATQLEYRLRVCHRVGIVAFAGIGDVAADITKFELKEFKYSYGGGIRWRIDETELIDLRLDIGLGKNTVEFYLSYNQAF